MNDPDSRETDKKGHLNPVAAVDLVSHDATILLNNNTSPKDADLISTTSMDNPSTAPNNLTEYCGVITPEIQRPVASHHS
jgi:hypothetical protein